MKVNIVSNFFGSSGFASHTKQLANALHEQGVEVRVDCQKPQGWETTVNDAEFLMLTREFDPDMVSILIGQPPFLPYILADNPRAVIPFVIWEGDTVPKYWLKHLLHDKVKQIWVPSTHVKDAIINTAESIDQLILSDKIKVVPHGVDLTIFDGEQEEKSNEPFVFLACKGWSQGKNDRGGVQFLIQAFTEEFTKEDDVEMRIKINPAYNHPNWNVLEEIEKLGIEKKDNSPRLLITAENVEYKQMKTFFQGNVFVSTSMAEGFNLPVLEGMAMGVPAIVTNFGGQTDFVNAENGWLVGGMPVEVTWDPQYEGISWLKPDVDQIKKAMRHCFENRDEVKAKGKKAREDAVKLTWTNAAKNVKELLKDL